MKTCPRLKEMGVAGVYGPGTSTETIVVDIRKAVAAAAQA